MMLQAGTNPSIDIQIVDDSGLPVTGLVASSFPAISYTIGGATAAVAVSLSDLALITTAYTSGGVKERNGGFYRFDLPAAAVASLSTQVRLIGEASGKRLLCPTIDVIAAPATHADAVSIAGGIAGLGSPMQASSYVAPTTPPTVVQIRQEMDANSTKLANCDVLTSSRLAASAYTAGSGGNISLDSITANGIAALRLAIAGLPVNIVGLVASIAGGVLPIVQGDDYNIADGTAIPFPCPETFLAGWTPVLAIDVQGTITTLTASVITDVTLPIWFEMTATQSRALTAGVPGTFSLRFTKAGHTHTAAIDGTVNVTARIG